MHQPMRDVLADPVASLHRPHPILELTANLEHRRIPGLVGAVPSHPEHLTAVVDDLDRGRTLVRVHPDDHTHPVPPLTEADELQQGGHRYFEQNKPLSSLSSRATRRDRKPCESHTNDTGEQPLNESVPPDTWTESGQTPILGEVSSSRMEGGYARPDLPHPHGSWVVRFTYSAT
jgi:hypothetical protein